MYDPLTVTLLKAHFGNINPNINPKKHKCLKYQDFCLQASLLVKCLSIVCKYIKCVNVHKFLEKPSLVVLDGVFREIILNRHCV